MKNHWNSWVHWFTAHSPSEKHGKTNKIHEFFTEKSRNPGIPVLQVALLYTSCFKALLEYKKESWNSRIPVLGGGFVVTPFLLKSN